MKAFDMKGIRRTLERNVMDRNRRQNVRGNDASGGSMLERMD